MPHSLRSVPFALVLGLGVAIGVLAPACSGGERAPDAARGRYLVEQVGLCADCHSPRDAQGRFVADQHLTGARLPFAPSVPMPWADTAPNIKGLPGLDDAQALAFLTKGELPGDRQLRPPMPAYRFSPADARDVIAYLRAPIAPLGSVAPAK